jgi:hypothetical protein
MLEEMALTYTMSPDSDIRALNFLATIMGGIFGGLTGRSMAEIGRVPYFVRSAMIYSLVSAFIFGLGGLLEPAINGGWVHVIVGFEIFAMVCAGWALSRIATARSRDAFGHGRMAALAFIPLANLWLMIAASRLAISARRQPVIDALSGRKGILTGVALTLVAAGLSTYGEMEDKSDVRLAMLDRILVALAAKVEDPVRIDGDVTLLRAEAKSREIRYIYEVSDPGSDGAIAMTRDLLGETCRHEGLSALIAAGVVVRHVQMDANGGEIATVSASIESCTPLELTGAPALTGRARVPASSRIGRTP